MSIHGPVPSRQGTQGYRILASSTTPAVGSQPRQQSLPLGSGLALCRKNENGQRGSCCASLEREGGRGTASAWSHTFFLPLWLWH